MSSIPTFSTQRLTLRPFYLEDAKEVQRLAGNPKVAATTATVPHPYLDGMAQDWISKHEDCFIKGTSITWAIELSAEKKLIGCISLGINQPHHRAELGYWIGEEFWNNGYCSEAAIATVRFAFETLRLNKITARHFSINPGSGRVMQKAGMEKEGYFKKDFLKNGTFLDMVVYGIIRKE